MSTIKLRIEDYSDGFIRVKCQHHAITGEIIDEIDITRDILVEDEFNIIIDHPKIRFYRDLGKIKPRAGICPVCTSIIQEMWQTHESI